MDSDSETIDSSSDRLRVMVLSSEYPPDIVGGLGTHVSELAAGLARRGCKLDVLTLTPNEPATRSDAGVSVHLISRKSLRPELYDRQGVHPAIREAFSFNDELVNLGKRLIERAGGLPDLIHCHEWFTIPAAMRLREALGVPVACTIHLIQNPVVNWWGQALDPDVVRFEKEYYPQPDMLIAVSRSMRELIRSVHNIEGERIQVVHNGCDLRLFTDPPLSAAETNALRKTVAAAADKIILFAGRLTPQKGITALFESAARVAEQFPAVRYLLVGEPDSVESADMVYGLKQRFSHLKPRIKLLGKLPRRQLAALYQVADLAVVPSIYEPFGYAAIEAMAARVPVVATSIGGLAEIIEHEENGLLVPIAQTAAGPYEIDVAALAEAQLSLLKDPAKADRIGRAGRASVTDRFTRDKMIEATLSVYRRTISQTRCASGSGSNGDAAARCLNM